MSTRQIPDRPCAYCRKAFRPGDWKCFNRPDACCTHRCAARLIFYQRGGRRRMVAGTKRRQASRRRKSVETTVGKRYGELSVREIELFNLGMRVGYDRGYAKAYNRRVKAAA